ATWPCCPSTVQASEVVPRYRTRRTRVMRRPRGTSFDHDPNTRSRRHSLMTYPKVSHLTGDSRTPAAVPSSPRFPAVEEAVLKYWDEDGTFNASVENREAGENGGNVFVFYD